MLKEIRGNHQFANGFYKLLQTFMKRNKLLFISVDAFQLCNPTIDKYPKNIDFANTATNKCILMLTVT